MWRGCDSDFAHLLEIVIAFVAGNLAFRQGRRVVDARTSRALHKTSQLALLAAVRFAACRLRLGLFLRGECDEQPEPASQSSRQPSALRDIRVSFFNLSSSMTSKHPTPGGSKPHAQPHPEGAQHNKSDIPGSVEVRGIIEAKLPSDLQKKRNADEAVRETRDKRRFRIEVVTLVFVIIYAALTGWYAWTSHKQWRDLRRNFEVSQRAWIKTGISWPTLVFDQPAVGKLVIKNIGKSPVTRLHCAVRLEVVGKDSEPTLSASERFLRVDTSIMFPADETSYQVYLPDKAGNARAFTSVELRDLTNGGDYLAMYGVVAYVDQFGAHWTRFCGYQPEASEGKFNASRCIAWNLTGDGNPPAE